MMTATVNERIEAFLDAGPYAVVGASANRAKYGNKILRLYQQHGWKVDPINPTAAEIEGQAAYPTLTALPTKPRAISVITPPKVTLGVLEEAAQLGIEHIWLQPGAEDAAVLARAVELGLSLIASGPCILVVAGYREA